MLFKAILKKEWFDMHSNKYTIGFMAIVTVLLGSFLSVAAGSLKEMQDLNVENDSKKKK